MKLRMVAIWHLPWRVNTAKNRLTTAKTQAPLSGPEIHPRVSKTRTLRLVRAGPKNDTFSALARAEMPMLNRM